MQLGELLQDPSSQIHDALTAGEEVLGQEQTVQFTPYVRVILPIDGFVFWMNASVLTPIALSQHNLQSPLTFEVQGSLHYASVAHQNPDETLVIRQVDFTSPTPIAALGVLSADVMYVGLVNTALGPFKFTFSRRNSFYEAAKIYHYVGDAVYPAFDDLLIETQADFDQRQIVSNSLPIWLSMFSSPPFTMPFTVSAPVYPAMLVLENIPPPYIAVEVEERPSLLQGVPIWNSTWTADQQCEDVVRLTTYGLRNDEIMSLRDFILYYSAVTGIIGIMRPPVVLDLRRPQVELAALAVKKQVELSVCYHQGAVRSLARQMIIKAGISVSENPHPIPPLPPTVN